jgi:hypothetical protein
VPEDEVEDAVFVGRAQGDALSDEGLRYLDASALEADVAVDVDDPFNIVAGIVEGLDGPAEAARAWRVAIGLGTFTFTMSALPGSPALQNAIPMPYFDTTLFAAPGLGLIAAAIMLGFGLW